MEVIDGQVMDAPQESTTLAPVEKQLVRQMGSPFDLTPSEFKGALIRREENRKVLIGWLKSLLVEGTDYGKIHVVSKNKCSQFAREGICKNKSHWSKDSLWKSGAEKICGYLGVTATFPNLKMYEDLAVQGRPINTIILRCELYDNSGNLVGEGTGSRSVAQDRRYDEIDINKSLKMAQKSAQIDATLRMAGLSEIFTQDLEPTEPNGNPSRQERQRQTQRKADRQSKADDWTKPLWDRAREAGMAAKEWTNIGLSLGIKSAANASREDREAFTRAVESWIADHEATEDTQPVEMATTDALQTLREAARSAGMARDDDELLALARAASRNFDLQRLDDMTMDELQTALDKVDQHGGDDAKQRPMFEDGE